MIFLEDNSTFLYEFADWPFVDKDHNNVITGNLETLNRNRLRKLFSKGHKYREKKTADYEKQN